MHGDLVTVGWFRDETAVSRKDIDLHWLSFVLAIRGSGLVRAAQVVLLFPYKKDGSVDLPGRLDGEWHGLDAAGRIELGRKIRGLARTLGIRWPLSVAASGSDWVVGNWEIFAPTANAEGEVQFVPDEWIRYDNRARRRKGEDLVDYVRRVLPAFQISTLNPWTGPATPMRRDFAASRPEIPFWVKISFFRGGRSDEDSWNVGYEDVHGPDSRSELGRRAGKSGLGKSVLAVFKGSLPDMLRIFWRDVMKIYPESERTKWEEKNVESFRPDMSADEIEVFQMIGERLPLLWPWPEFEQWATECGR